MSVVDNYALFFSIVEDDEDAELPPIVKHINDRIGLAQSTNGFRRVDQHAGGSKAFEAPVFLFAGNHFELQEMAKVVTGAPWECPEDVRLAHCPQWKEAFEMYTLDALRRLAS